jgi:hypothetical protein
MSLMGHEPPHATGGANGGSGVQLRSSDTPADSHSGRACDDAIAMVDLGTRGCGARDPSRDRLARPFDHLDEGCCGDLSRIASAYALLTPDGLPDWPGFHMRSRIAECTCSRRFQRTDCQNRRENSGNLLTTQRHEACREKHADARSGS